MLLVCWNYFYPLIGPLEGAYCVTAENILSSPWKFQGGAGREDSQAKAIKGKYCMMLNNLEFGGGGGDECSNKTTFHGKVLCFE